MRNGARQGRRAPFRNRFGGLRMNKIFALATGLVALSVLPAAAANVEWRGAAILTAVTGCGTDYAVGNAIPMRYRASGLGDNGANSKFAVHQTFYAQSFVVTGRFPATATTVNAGGLGAGWGSFVVPAKVKMISISPTGYGATTPALTLVGEIQNFGEIAGCTVAFRAAGALKP